MNNNKLTQTEAQELDQTIKKNLKAFVEVGLALVEMRDRKGYLSLGYNTFEQYIRQELGLSKGNAYNYIGAAEVALLTSNQLDFTQAVELARLADPPDSGDRRKKVIDIEAVREVAATLDFGQATVKMVAHAVNIKLAERRKQKHQANETVFQSVGEKYRLITCAVGDLSNHIQDETIDAIITDPPYPKEYLPVYADLATMAIRLLKPGAPLIVLIGHSHLPEICALMTPHIGYLWCLAYLTPANTARVFSAKALVNWKPVLVFSSGSYTGDWYADVLNNSAPDKRYHEWGQGESGFAALVERFTTPGQTILDPFCGGSATGAAALKMGRRYIGADLDPDCIAISAQRLAEPL